jgi:hypothetical protein
MAAFFISICDIYLTCALRSAIFIGVKRLKEGKGESEKMKLLFASQKKQAAYEFLVTGRDQNNMIRITYSELAAKAGCTLTHAARIVKQLQADNYLQVISSERGGGTILEVWTPEEKQIS